jgi:hypothetical protein
MSTNIIPLIATQCFCSYYMQTGMVKVIVAFLQHPALNVQEVRVLNHI